MIDKLKSLIQGILDKANFLDHEQKLSLTNITVALFVLICSVRMAFGGSTLNISTFKWIIQPIDTAGTLPVLFSLLNYGHKRQIINSSTDGKDTK